MRKRLFIFIAIVATLLCLFAISASARTEDYNDTFVLKNEASIVHYEKWYYNENKSYVRKGYTDTVTLSFLDTEGNPLTEVPMWEYDAEEGRYYSLVWYISDYELTWEDQIYEDANVGQQTYPKYTSAVYTLSKVRAVDLRFVFNQYNTTHDAWKDADGNKITYSLKSLKGIYHANGTPDDTSDDIRLQHAQGIGRDQDNYGYVGYDAQFEATGNKIVVGNFRDCDFQRDEEGNYGTANTFSRADNLQCIWLPDTVKYWVGGGFSGCYEIDLGDGIEVIACQILRDNKRIKEIRIPNSVIFINNESFRGTDLTTLILGEGVTLHGGSPFLYTGTADNTVISKNIVNSTTAVAGAFLGGKDSKQNIYLVGSLTDAEALKAHLISRDSNFGNSGRIVFYDYNETQERASTDKYTVIFYNYNRCDAFYYGDHVIVDDKNCTTKDNCTRSCGIAVPDAQASHANAEKLTYSNGFAAEGLFCVSCQNDGCEVKTEQVQNAIFTASGYSVNNTGTALCGGYTVDLKALEFYEKKNGDLVYGIVIANAGSFAGKSFFENKEVNSDKALQVEIDSQFKHFNCSINFGATSNNSLNLIICAYVIDGENVSFIQADSGDTVDSSLVAGGSFKSVTLDKVVALVPTGKENRL